MGVDTNTLQRIQPALEQYRELLPWETYRRYRDGKLPKAVLFLLQAPELAQVIADIAKKENEAKD